MKSKDDADKKTNDHSMENDSNNLMLDKDDIEEKKLNKMSEEEYLEH